MSERKKILIAETEPLIKEILSIFFRDWEYDFFFVARGNDLLEEIKRFSPDIILIDNDLPDIDGLSICKILKEDFITTHIPLILLIEKKGIRKKMLDIPQGVDDYIFKPPDPIDLEIRIEMAARRTEHQLQTNSLTRLPGTISAERIIKLHLQKDTPFSVLYLDIDNFKLFNDRYGYARGDIVIKQVSHIISMTTKNCGNRNDFVGHIGGDDFVVITTPQKERVIAETIIADFDRLMPYHYSDDDRKKGYIISITRDGKKEKIPLMSVSIAIVNNKERKFKHLFELTHLLAEIKRYLKSLPGSNFLINRRIKEEPRKIHTVNLVEGTHKEQIIKEDTRPKPLGQMLLEEGLITKERLYDCLYQHFNTSAKIGQVFLRNKIINESLLDNLLEKQRLA